MGANGEVNPVNGQTPQHWTAKRNRLKADRTQKFGIDSETHCAEMKRYNCE